MLKNLWCDEEGASMTEYILVVCLIGLAAFAALKAFGGQINSLFKSAGDKLKSAKP